MHFRSTVPKYIKFMGHTHLSLQEITSLSYALNPMFPASIDVKIVVFMLLQFVFLNLTFVRPQSTVRCCLRLHK
jgi:hypothetical protein